MKLMRLTSLFLVGLLVLTACGANGFDIVINENIEAEYGEELDHTILFDAEKSEKDLTVKEVRDFDKMKTGEQEITVVFALGEDTQEEKVKVNVKDTKAPEITFKSETMEITLGDSFDANANIESVKDPIDGDIKHSTDNTITQDGYVIAADIKSEAGEYTVAVTAFDKNGNKAEKSYKLVIKEKAEENNQPVASNQGGSQTQTPSHNNGTVSNSGGQANNGNSGGSTTTPPKKVCPNGNVPLDPNLPCDAWYSGDYDTCYKDANGNIVVFSTSQEAYTWAKNAWLSGEIKESYSNFVTTPISKNDGSHYYGVSFE